jgi:ADP-ribose pyrophosphatase YjhB (NUDIX family)
LFIDYHDAINVLVEDTKATHDNGGERYFFAFEQTKYSLEGRNSLAIIGGIIEPGEEAELAAKREVNEELDGIVCKKFHFLGRFRRDVNRGIGWVHSFLALDCEKGGVIESEIDVSEEVGAPDIERQDILSISTSVLREKVKEGQFLEVQWSNTVSLALLHDQMKTERT